MVRASAGSSGGSTQVQKVLRDNDREAGKKTGGVAGGTELSV